MLSHLNQMMICMTPIHYNHSICILVTVYIVLVELIIPRGLENFYSIQITYMYASMWSVNQMVIWIDQQKNASIPLLTLAMKAVTWRALNDADHPNYLTFPFISVIFSGGCVCISTDTPKTVSAK